MFGAFIFVRTLTGGIIENMKKMIAFIICVVFLSGVCFAEEGIVVGKEKSRYSIECKQGFVLAEWQGGYRPLVGDLYSGDFNTIGFRKLKCVNMQQETNFWIEDFRAPEDKAYNFLYEKTSSEEI